MRILSLLPSATEIVFALGLGDELVGVSHECDYPPEAHTKPVVSTSSVSPALRSNEIHCSVSEHHHTSHSLYNIDQPLLRELNPDVILTQELCSVCAVPVAQVREAARILAGPCRIVSLEPNNLHQILDTISAVGEVAGHAAKAHALVAELEKRIASVASTAVAARTRARVFCMEVYIVDSPAYFSRPGPRIVKGLEILAQMIHPELFSGLIPPGAAVKLEWSKAEQHTDRPSAQFVPVT